MKTFNNPSPNEWKNLIQRPSVERSILEESVRTIIADVKRNGDNAIQRYTRQLDGVNLTNFKASNEEIQFAIQSVPEELKQAIQLAKENIEKFHSAQLTQEPMIETSPGVTCWRKNLPIEKVGLYIPGGSAPLFSTILMLGIPAKIAGCSEVILCTPPQKDGSINPAILYTANLIGITQIYKAGGAQAIAAMANGTETIPSVYKIFGPGNQYVTKAKELIQQTGVAIDMPAGPSEVLVIADETGIPAFIAADLLSQAEHGSDSQVMLVSNDANTIRSVKEEIALQLESIPRVETALKALEFSRAILLDDLDTCLAFSNAYGPEHLIIASENAESYINKITNAGSVFIGNYSCESAGDYASGTNHTLPTNGFAKNYSGVSVDSFVKKITFQNLSAEGLNQIGPAIEIMAEAEALIAHKNAVSIRLDRIRTNETPSTAQYQSS